MIKRTNIEIEVDLLREVMSITKSRTMKDAIQAALKHVIKSNRKKELLDLKGKIRWEGNLDEMRQA
ncbi:MAG: type II toxin-antitoxin system VapB family antitoxin [Mangrovibacterium sp.]